MSKQQGPKVRSRKTKVKKGEGPGRGVCLDPGSPPWPAETESQELILNYQYHKDTLVS